jgi:hypothetical protein
MVNKLKQGKNDSENSKCKMIRKDIRCSTHEKTNGE